MDVVLVEVANEVGQEDVSPLQDAHQEKRLVGVIQADRTAQLNCPGLELLLRYQDLRHIIDHDNPVSIPIRAPDEMQPQHQFGF